MRLAGEEGYSQRRLAERIGPSKTMVNEIVKRNRQSQTVLTCLRLSVRSCATAIHTPDAPLAYEYLAALLNSKLLDEYLRSFSSKFRGGYYAYNRQYIEQLPIQTIDFSNVEEVDRHDDIVKLVKQMIELQERSAEAKIEQERKVIGQQIATTDRQIDRLMYEPYELTDDEIAVVESAAAD